MKFRIDTHQTLCRRRRSRAVPRILLLTLAMLVPLASLACRRGVPKTNEKKDAKRTCADQLEASIEMAQPEKLGSTTNYVRTTERFNDWYRDCPDVHEIPAAVGPQDEKLAGALFTKPELKRLHEDSFDEQDVRHIRNSLLFSRIAVTAIPDSTASDLRQTVDLFAYVVRNIELVEVKPDDTPRPPFHVLMLGRGTANDRAWIFAELLRQLKIPSVILTSGKMDAAAGSAFLVGVPLNDQVYLFDPRLGLPIPSPDETSSDPFIRMPATLKQFVENPKVAAGLNVGEKRYPLTADDLKSPRVGLVVHRSLLTPRLKRLHYLKDVKWRKAVMSDGLDDEKLSGPGLFNRMVKVGEKHWTPDAIGIWPYPTQVFRRFASRSDRQRSLTTSLMRPFSAPLKTSIDKKTKKLVIERTTDLQLRARILQWQGDYLQAVQNYVSVRLQCGLSPVQLSQFPQQNRDMMGHADEDASYWIGACKFEQGDYPACIRTLEDYVSPPTPRKWRTQAMYLLALARMSQKKPATALTLMDQISKDNPQAIGNRILWKRWDAIRQAELKKNEKP